jgi:hypothetical protein
MSKPINVRQLTADRHRLGRARHVRPEPRRRHATATLDHLHKHRHGNEVTQGRQDAYREVSTDHDVLPWACPERSST